MRRIIGLRLCCLGKRIERDFALLASRGQTTKHVAGTARASQFPLRVLSFRATAYQDLRKDLSQRHGATAEDKEFHPNCKKALWLPRSRFAQVLLFKPQLNCSAAKFLLSSTPLAAEPQFVLSVGEQGALEYGGKLWLTIEFI